MTTTTDKRKGITTVDDLASNLYQAWMDIDTLAAKERGEALCTAAKNLLEQAKDALRELEQRSDGLLNQVYEKLIARTMAYANTGKIEEDLAVTSKSLLEELIKTYQIFEKTTAK